MRSSVAAALAFALAGVAACAPPHRSLAIVPTLPRCVTAPVNTVRVSALGDFPPEATLTAAASAMAGATLALPRATRVVDVEGFGPAGLAAFGRTAPLSLDDVGDGQLGVAYGPPDGLCATGAMTVARAGHRAATLASGAVLVAGGYTDDPSGMAVAATATELYLPDGDATTPPAHFRSAAAALDPGAVMGVALAPLGDGGALVAGGVGVRGDGLADGIASQGALRVDGVGRPVGAPKLVPGDGRAFASATVLPDGRVLLAGGCALVTAGACSAGKTLATTTIYDPAADAFSAGPPLVHARFSHDAVLRGDDTVLLVGGVGEGGATPPAEIVDPAEARGFDAGFVGGRAAALDAGSVLVAGGGAAADTTVSLWLSPTEAPLPLPALGDARRSPTVTPLDDGGALIAGGGDGPLYVFDGRGAVTALPAAFAARDHAAARLGDGTVLLAGGADDAGVPRADALVYFRSPLSAWANLPPLTLDGTADPYLPRRPDRAAAAAGQLVVTAPAASADGRPAEWALVAGLVVGDASVDVLGGRRGPAGAALVVGWRSEADYAFVVLAPGRAVELWRVSSPRSGQSLAAAVAGCRGVVLADGALPDGDVAPLHLDWRRGRLTVAAAGATVLDCRPPDLGRGRVGVAALAGTVAFDNVTVTR